jgi:hypothetical protein
MRLTAEKEYFWRLWRKPERREDKESDKYEFIGENMQSEEFIFVEVVRMKSVW